jgi:hypothetical protein
MQLSPHEYTNIQVSAMVSYVYNNGFVLAGKEDETFAR